MNVFETLRNEGLEYFFYRWAEDWGPEVARKETREFCILSARSDEEMSMARHYSNVLYWRYRGKI